ncbi:hypothetical protein LPJ63_002848 [Coemansia sp. RSA 2711]|nr:hypothetical protein LPJ63_002848 [Coemansia sp. RSA 2711]
MSAVAKPSPAGAVKKARTGRKARSDWRKNIDLKDVEQGLEEMREEERQGGVIEKRENAALFVMDTGGDEKAKSRQRQRKTLRLDEILGKRSSVPVPVLGTKLGEERKRRRDIQEIRKRLKMTAGIVDGRRTAPQGIQQGEEPQAFDIWGAADESAKVPKSKSKHVVSRQKLAHIAALPAVEIAHPGASYRPTQQDHQQLVKMASSEYATELRKAGEFAEFSTFRGLAHNDGMNECADVVIEEMAQAKADNAGSGDNSDGDEATVNGSSDEDTKGSTRKIKVPKRKTRVDRNRQRRTAQRLEEERQAKEAKGQLRQLQQAKQLNNKVDSEIAELEKAVERRHKERQERALQPRKRIGKQNVPKVPEAVQLSDELAGSLRQLQPETNSFSDAFNSFVKRNIIEPRGPRRPKRTSRKIKTIEKWSHKYFK